MTIATYATLQAAVANWLNRPDLTAYIPDFITLAATRIYYGSDDPVIPSAPVRAWSMMQTEAPVVTGQAAPLPANFLETILIRGYSGTNAWTADYVSPSIYATNSNRSTGVAVFYTILANQILISSSATTTLTHDYFGSFAAFAADADTNALLTTAPGLWLHGALIEAYVFLGDDNGAQKSHRMYAAAASGLNKVAKSYGGGTLAVTAR